MFISVAHEEFEAETYSLLIVKCGEVGTYVCVHEYVYMHVGIRAYIRICVHVCMCMYVCI